MIYEERRITLKRRQTNSFVSHFKDSTLPAIKSHGGDVLCTLSGAIGDPPEELMQITAYPDVDAWTAAQEAFDTSRLDHIEAESVRLMKSIASRPKQTIPDEDARPFYGHRRFFISPDDLDEFVLCSEEGVWPRIEAQDARILGLWTTLASTTPQEIVLITGYHGPAHWEATRVWSGMPEGFDPELWERGNKLRQRRYDMTRKSWVRLMQRLEI
jgi:hypothetical protein